MTSTSRDAVQHHRCRYARSGWYRLGFLGVTVVIFHALAYGVLSLIGKSTWGGGVFALLLILYSAAITWLTVPTEGIGGA